MPKLSQTFRVSTEDGDTYSFKARDIEEARKIAAEDNVGRRFTVYQEKNAGRQ